MATEKMDKNGVRWLLVDVPSRPGFFFGTMAEGQTTRYDPVPPDIQPAVASAVIARINEFAATHTPVIVVQPDKEKSSGMTVLLVLGLLYILSRRR